MISISIELVLLILIAVIMFFSILTGLCQGFRKNMFKLGDVVKVQKGVFKNLYAVVTQVINQKQILGVFKFISGYRIQRLTVDNCQYKNNFFDVVRVAYK